MTDQLAIELMGINEEQADLIREACTEAQGSIRVMDLDKGLSGARVLLAQWPLEAKTESALHVLKIGSRDKLQREIERVKQFVCPVDPKVGHIELFSGPEGSEYCLLRQAFEGSHDGKMKSLREWIGENQEAQKVASQIGALYEKRMLQWHCPAECVPPKAEQTLDNIFKGRMERVSKLPNLFEEIGAEALKNSFAKMNLATAEQIHKAVDSIRSVRGNFARGLVHGDLHAQNVLVGDNDELHLIDFAWAGYNWKAVDFLMMECSLKFIVAPRDAQVEDLVKMERFLDGKDDIDPADFEQLGLCVYGQNLQVFASAVNEVRRQARKCRAVRDFDQYRRGLIILTACLSTFPEFNRNFLAHSLAFHVAQLN